MIVTIITDPVLPGRLFQDRGASRCAGTLAQPGGEMLVGLVAEVGPRDSLSPFGAILPAVFAGRDYFLICSFHPGCPFNSVEAGRFISAILNESLVKVLNLLRRYNPGITFPVPATIEGPESPDGIDLAMEIPKANV